MRAALLQLVIALCALLGSFTLYGVLYNAVSAKSALAANLASQINEKTAATTRAKAAQMALSDVASDEAAVQAYFVSNTSVVPFIDDLESRGRTLGTTVTVTSVSPGKVGGQPVFLLSLTITGSFDSVMRTAGAIEYAPYDVVVSSFAVVESADASWSANMSLSVGTASSSPVSAVTTLPPVTATSSITAVPVATSSKPTPPGKGVPKLISD